MQILNININNYESFILDYLEGNLDERQIAEFKVFLEENPSIKSEVESFDLQGIESTYLSVPEIELPNKSALYRRPIFSIWHNPTVRYSVAACFIVLLGLEILFKYGSIPMGNSFENTLAVLPDNPLPSTLDSVQEINIPPQNHLRQNTDLQVSKPSTPSKIDHKHSSSKLLAAKAPVLPEFSSEPLIPNPIVFHSTISPIMPIMPEIVVIMPKIIQIDPNKMTMVDPLLVDSLLFAKSCVKSRQFVDSLLNHWVSPENSLSQQSSKPSFGFIYRNRAPEDFSNYTADDSPRAKVKTFARKIMHAFYRQKYEFECKVYKYEKNIENFPENLLERQKNINNK